MAWTKEQQQAIDESGTNIIVSAGAGSGKTAVLTARTMRLLNDGIHINELLILTFTKAAAAEMKERIRKSIKNNAKDNAKLKKELELIDQAYITTFDSFALSIVKKYHYLLNISNNITITDSSIIEMQKVKIMDEVFSELYTNPNEEFTSLISDFCVKDDDSIKKSLLYIANKIDALIDSDNYLDTYFKKYFSQEFIDQCLLEYQNILLEQIEEIKNQALTLISLTDGDYAEKIKPILEPLFNAKTIDDISKTIAFIKLPMLPKGSEEETKQQKDVLSKLIKELLTTTKKYGLKEEIIDSITKTIPNIKAIIEIIKSFLYKLHIYKSTNNIYDFQDIALLAIKILQDNPDIKEELKKSFKEIMIDEYQDTNDIQETFISMIENNNVYMVGDIKQSIYRFRNANPYIFKNKYDKYSQKDNGLKIDLVKNFRSRKEVLTNINEIFNLIMDNLIGGAEYKATHQMIFGNTKFDENKQELYDYNMSILEYEIPTDKKYSKEEIEIFSIAKDIKGKVSNKIQIFDKEQNLLRPIEYKDFAILIDRTTDFDLYKKIFEFLGIPLTLFKDERLNTSDDIYLLKNIIDFIIRIKEEDFNQEFKYDYISIARSYLYRLTDEEIFLSFKNNDFKNNIVYQELSVLSEKLSSLSISSFIEEIIAKTNMYEKVITIGNIDSFMIRISSLLDLADNLNSLGYDIYNFKDYLKELLELNYDIKYKASDYNSNAVKLMTIHASKGLEYYICYYSGLYKDFNISDIKDRFIYDNKYGIISPYFAEGINETFIKYLIKYNFMKEEISEKIRLFYVALTRAREQMIIFLPKKDNLSSCLTTNGTIDLLTRKKYRSFADIIYSVKQYLLKYFKNIELDKLNLTKDYLYNTKSLNKISSTNNEVFNVEPIELNNIEYTKQEHFSKEENSLIDKRTYDNMHYGTLIHETLEYLDFNNPDYSLIQDQFIKNKIQKFLANNLLQNIKNAKIYKEYEFIYEEDNIEYHGIIDLLLEYPDYIDIIDYKLNNIKDDKYLKQLNGYKNYINKITNKKVNLYLYSIVNETIEKI